MKDRIRKKLRLSDYNYSNNNYYFVTIACHKKQDFLINAEVRKLVISIWESLTIRFSNVYLDEFIIMPDHIHGIVIINDRASPVTTDNCSQANLSDIIGAFKSITAIKANKILNRIGLPFWQRSFHDHIIRNNYDLDSIRKYIRYNKSKYYEC